MSDVLRAPQMAIANPLIPHDGVEHALYCATKGEHRLRNRAARPPLDIRYADARSGSAVEARTWRDAL
jgi:hypothetical protein